MSSPPTPRATRRTTRRATGRVVASLLGPALLLGSAACTGGADPSAEREGERSARPPQATAPPSVPLRTAVTHVAGRLPRADRKRLATRVGRTISAYVDAAFLEGDYPRSGFGSSFGAFTPGAARQARRDVSLLTNQPLGSTTTTVRATRRTAYLSVLAPKGRVAGATAAVNLVFRVDRGSRPGRRVHLRGRLLMTRDRSGAWAIFGYDLTRSSVRARGAS